MTVLMPGAEPFLFRSGKTGCLLVHGFTASPQEMRFLGQSLAREGYTTLGVRLAGHGTTLKDMERTRWKDWLASVEDGYHLLRAVCSHVGVIGFSQGGALALRLCAEMDVDALVTISTPFTLPPDRRLQLLHPVLKPLSRVVHSMAKGTGGWVDPSLAEDRVAYDGYPLRSIAELDALLADMRAHLGEVTAPLLSIHSRRDDFVPPDHLTRIQAAVGSSTKQRAYVEQSFHLIVVDVDRERVLTHILDFLRTHLPVDA